MPVHYALERAVATVTLDDPERRNALSAELVDDLRAGLDRAAADPSVRAVVLTHTGSVFCAGADLREESSSGGPQRGTARLVSLLRAVVELPLPVVACLDGTARAGGIGLLGACDVALATSTSTFAFSEVRLGLAPVVISLTALSRMTPRSAARYALTGEVFGAVEAVDAGLLTASAAELGPLADEVLSGLRQGSPQGLAETKRVTTRSLVAAFDRDERELREWSSRLFASPQAQAGMAAFLARRPPPWRPVDD